MNPKTMTREQAFYGYQLVQRHGITEAARMLGFSACGLRGALKRFGLYQPTPRKNRLPSDDGRAHFARLGIIARHREDDPWAREWALRVNRLVGEGLTRERARIVAQIEMERLIDLSSLTAEAM